MNKKLILYAFLTFLSGACTKHHDSSNGSSNSWTFAGTSYTAATVTYIDGGSTSNLSATATSGNGLVFAFTPPPISNGQVLITNTNDPNTALVGVSKLSGTTTTFYTNDVTTTNANVNITGGKVSTHFEGNIWLHNISDFNDSAQLSVGTITQQ